MVDSKREAFQKTLKRLGCTNSDLEREDWESPNPDPDAEYESAATELAWEAWQASRSAAIEECAAIAKREQRHWANPETETALLNVEGALRALKGEG